MKKTCLLLLLMWVVVVDGRSSVAFDRKQDCEDYRLMAIRSGHSVTACVPQ
jgi:hypothetical protein